MTVRRRSNVRSRWLKTTCAKLALFVAVLASALVSTRIACATPTARLIYVRGEGAAGCPGEDELRKAVVQRLGYDPFFAVAEVTLVAEIEKREPVGFVGHVKVIDKDGKLSGTRVIQSASRECGELLRTLALNLSITVDDLAAILPQTPDAPPNDPQPTPPPPALAPRTPPPVEERPDETEKARPKRTVFPELGVLLVGNAGQTPALTLGLGASLGVRAGPFRFTGDATALLPSEGSEGAYKARASVLQGTLSACLHLALPYACAKGSIGALDGGGAGIDEPKAGTALVAGVGIEPGVEVVLSEHLVVRAFADVKFALVRPSVTVNGVPAFRTGPASLGLGLAGVVRF